MISWSLISNKPLLRKRFRKTDFLTNQSSLFWNCFIGVRRKLVAFEKFFNDQIPCDELSLF